MTSFAENVQEGNYFDAFVDAVTFIAGAIGEEAPIIDTLLNIYDIYSLVNDTIACANTL